MVIREILKKAADILYDNGIEDSDREAAILLSYVLEKSLSYIYTHMDDSINKSDESMFSDFIEKRAKGMPAAYIIGKTWFMSFELYVNEFTLIPRPETEELVEATLESIKNMEGSTISLLDICTGSGCVGLAAAHYDERVRGLLCDVSENSIEMAKRNIEKLGLGERVNAVKGDLFSPAKGNKFDIITANPPYIPSADISGLMRDVRDFEPLSALDGGDDGLVFYRRIAEEASEYLYEQGVLFLEIGIDQSEAVIDILAANGFSNIQIKNDISGIPRIISAEYHQNRS